MDSFEKVDLRFRVLESPKYDRHGNHEVLIEDATGEIADLRVWQKQHGHPDWRVGATYDVQQAKRHPPESDTARYETAADSSIRRVGQPKEPEATVLHLSDTHLGRKLTDKEHMGDGNQLARFLDAVNFGIKYRVDAVLHTGDIFDDAVSKETRDVVAEHLELLDDKGIPFYYVRGHHGCDRGDTLLRRQTEKDRIVHLGSAPQLLGDGKLALYGMDAETDSDDLVGNAPTERPPRDAYRLLAWHQAVQPLARSGVPIQRAVSASEVEIDALALGDLHKSKRAYVDEVMEESGRNLRMFYAGATTSIAKWSEGYEPAVWLLQLVEGRLERRRLPLGTAQHYA